MTRLFMLSMFTTFFSLFSKAQSNDVSTLPPINDLGTGEFMGHQGGLYPNGSNTMPAAFYNDALVMAQSIQPLDKSGNPDPNGKIGLIALGASTIEMFSKGLETQLPKAAGMNKAIRFVNCGIGGQDMSDIMNPAANFWTVIDNRLTAAGISREQVQVLWMQEDNLRNRSNGLDERGQGLVHDFTYMVTFCKQHYPNLKLFYMTGRHTTAFMPADGKDKHKEPKAYVNGWACKWVIENQINGEADLAYKGPDAKAPLVLWGPYFWTQGTTPRKTDGYSWSSKFLSADGIHPNEDGIARVSGELIDFWSKDPVSQQWFLEQPGAATVNTETLEYMHLTVNQTVVNDILYNDITDPFRLMVLKDSTIILKNDNAHKQSSLVVDIKEPGKYNYLISDANGKAVGGKFIVDEDMTVEVVGNKSADPKVNDSVSTNYIDPNAPAWIVNGQNKLPKLKRLMAGHNNVKAVVYDTNGKVLLEVQDVLNKHTDLNESLERGEFPLKFFDENGNEIVLPEDFRDTVRIKY